MMAAVASPQPRMSSLRDDAVMDTRTPSPVHAAPSPSLQSESGAPDLSAEVAMLSTKLVNAINYQTNLDDSLQQTRHELDVARKRIRQLEEETERHKTLVSNGLLVWASDMNKIIVGLRKELSAERAARADAEKGKKQVEGELENLTTALFEEANTMVAAARKDTEAVERRNAQLRGQLEEYEQLMAAQREQLTDLKGSMEKLEGEQPATRDSSMPSTPITAHHAALEPLQLSVSSLPDTSPEHPLHFTTLINPVLRNDTKAFEDFQDLLLLARRLGAHSRTNSNQASAANSSHVNTSSTLASSPNIPGSFVFGSSSPTAAYYGAQATMPPLKESKFYKRVLTEDIEPTLRLDLAPGLSFLSRRTVLASLLAGTLNVEPYPQNKHYFACTLCGETKRQEQYVRRHRFLTSEEDTVSKPLCDFCTARVRTTCDFVGWLRMVRDGHWKCDTEEDQKSAWEESVKLRERMFWARLGGGVVPCFSSLPRSGLPSPISAHGSAHGSPHGSVLGSGRQSLEDIPERSDQDQASGRPSQDRPTPSVRVSLSSDTDVSEREAKLVENSVECTDFGKEEAVDAPGEGTAAPSSPATPFEDAKEEAMPEALQTETSRSDLVQEKLDSSEAANDTKIDEVSRAAGVAKQENGNRDDQATDEPPTAVEGDVEPAKPKRVSVISTRAASPSPGDALSPTVSLEAPRPGSSAGRKGSSVLERVKAMEASKQ